MLLAAGTTPAIGAYENHVMFGAIRDPCQQFAALVDASLGYLALNPSPA